MLKSLMVIKDPKMKIILQVLTMFLAIMYWILQTGEKGSGGRETQTQHETTIRRLDKIERKVKEIVTKMNDVEQSTKKDRDGTRVLEKMFVRLEKVERENKILKDENMALRLENFDLRDELIERMNKDVHKEPKWEKVPKKGGQWRFPDILARERGQISSSFVSKNDLDYDSGNEMNLRNSSKIVQNREKTQQKLQSTTTNLGNYGGAKLRSVKDTALTRDYEHMQNRGKTEQLTQLIILISRKHEEKGAFHAVNGNINLRDVSYSTAVIQGQRRSSWGHQIVTPNSGMHEGELNRNTEQLEIATSNQGPSRTFKYSQNNNVAEPFQRPNRKIPVLGLVGDAIIKGIRRNELNYQVNHMSTFVKTFPGATTDDMESYIVPTLKREPDALIIHCGTNNLRKDDPETIAKKITDIALKSKRTVKNVAVSSILVRGDSDLIEWKRLQVNSLLMKSLANNEIQYILFDTKILIMSGDIYYSVMTYGHALSCS